MSREPRRTSLRLRITVWMVTSTLLTLVVFCGTLYLALEQEDASDAGTAPATREPMTREAGEQMLLAALLAGPIALLAAASGAYFSSRRALAPLDQLIRGARRVTTSSLAQRLVLPARRDELYDLTLELNALLGRLDEGFGALARHAANASHELRTPLAVVISQLEVAARHPRTPEQWQEAVRSCLSELRRLSKLVEALLALSRADGPLERETLFDVREQIDWILASVAEQARAKNIALSPLAAGNPGCGHVFGDPDAVNSALRNVVENAVQFTPQGGHVRVTLAPDAGDLLVTVDDSGPGVDVDERQAIFQPLRRGRAAASAGGPRHGLGLAIVERVVQRHNGSVRVAASPEGGARFELRLPRAHGGPSRVPCPENTAP